jgi:SAM-dependent methyltransferase
MTTSTLSDRFINRQKRSREDFLDRHWEAHDWANHCFSGAAYALWREAGKLIADHARGLVLDAGAGRGSWRRTILHTATGYESIDLARRGEQETTWIGSIEDMPQVSGGRYDTVICQQVLEHVPRPTLALREFARVLKPGGKLTVSVPHLSRRHELPNDYYPYTQEGLSYLVREAGFEVSQVATYGGLLSFIHHQTSFFFPGAFLRIPLVADAALALNALLSWLASTLDRNIDRRALLPLVILLVAEKPHVLAD